MTTLQFKEMMVAIDKIKDAIWLVFWIIFVGASCIMISLLAIS